MKVEFLRDGESPEIGEYIKGKERNIPADVAKVLASRKVCKIIEVKKKKEARDGRE